MFILFLFPLSVYFILVAISNVKQQQQQHEIRANPSNAHPSQTTTQVERLGNVFIKDDVLDFPDTEIGKTSEIKFRLCNDGSEVKRVRRVFMYRYFVLGYR